MTIDTNPSREEPALAKGKVTEPDILSTYINQVKGIASISIEEEKCLVMAMREGNEAARKRIIEAHLGLVVKIAKAYRKQDIPLMELIQEGNLGLLKAADRFDPEKTARFSTYACWWIRQGIIRYISDLGSTLRLPHRKLDRLHQIQKAYHVLSQRFSRQPKHAEIALETGIPLEEVEFLTSMSRSLLSLDAEEEGEEDAGTMMDVQEDYTYSPERALLRKSSRLAAFRVLNHLLDRERRILIYRYLVKGEKRQSLKNIGDRMGLSPERVRQIEVRALRKIRSQAEELEGCLYAM
jgi:RNA polymerase primary sigma factor